MRGFKHRIKKVILLGCMAIVVGAFCNSKAQAQTQTADFAGARKAIVQGYQQGKKRVDVSAYHLYNHRDAAKVNDMMTEVLAKTTGLFYADQEYAKLIVPSTKEIKEIELQYLKSFCNKDGSLNQGKVKKVQKQIQAKIKTILKNVTGKMTAVEKAMVLHDYLVQNTGYYDGTAAYCTSEWGVLLKGKGNCQGYSKAYGLLLEGAGIPVDYIDSASMAHMWNIIQIKGKWYHVDVTWDDPVDPNTHKNQEGLVLHDNFLRSTSAMKAAGYRSFSCRYTTSRKYDKKYWKSVNSAFVYCKGKWLYQTNKDIRQRTHLEKGKANILYEAGGRAFVQGTAWQYYFINYNRVFLYNRKKNTIRIVFDGRKKYSAYTISQLKCAKGKLSIRMCKHKKVKTIRKKITKSGKLTAITA